MVAEPVYENIKLKITDGVYRIILNRPPLNILNIAMMQELNDCFQRAIERADEFKVMVIGAEGKAFSAGVDVAEHTADKVSSMLNEFHKMFKLLAKVSMPTVAITRGATLGGGCELATFCDFVLASENAKFGVPEIQVGVFPPIAAFLFPRILNNRQALQLILSGEIISAATAKQIGLITEVFPVAEFETKVETYINENLLTKSGIVLKLTKRALTLGGNYQLNFDDAICQLETLYLQDLMSTADANEGLKAYLEKRKPQWKNR